MQYVQLVWRCYVADDADLKAIPTLEKHYELTGPASPNASGAMADVEVSADRLPLSSAVPDDDEDWSMGVLIEVDPVERVGVKLCIRDLQ